MRPIYIVDDDPDVRAAVAFMLAAAGRPARTFGSADALLSVLGELEPGCLLIDMRMPRRDGLELLQALRTEGCGWPVILMTGHGDIPLAARAISGGAVDFLEKPFAEELLDATLAAAERLLETGATLRA